MNPIKIDFARYKSYKWLKRRSARPDYRLPAWSSPAVSIFPHFFFDLFTWCLSFPRSEKEKSWENVVKIKPDLNNTSFLDGMMLCLFFSLLLNEFTCRFLSPCHDPAFLLSALRSSTETARLHYSYSQSGSRCSYISWHNTVYSNADVFSKDTIVTDPVWKECQCPLTVRGLTLRLTLTFSYTLWDAYLLNVMHTKLIFEKISSQK